MKTTIGAVLFAAILAPSLAAAHALLQQASPSDGSVLHTPPQSIELTFSENARLTALSIQRQNAGTAQRIAALPGGASRHFVISAPRLAAGAYTIRYRLVSSDDGHITAGAISFTLATADSGPAAALATPAAAGPGDYNAIGTVDRVDETGGRVTISHGPISSLGWPAMTMAFVVKDKALYDKLAVGRRVQFTLTKQGALYVVTAVK